MSFIIYLSESGYPGLQDLQDFDCSIVGLILCLYLSESGCPGLKDFQDFDCLIVGEFYNLFVRIRISRIKGFSGCLFVCHC